MRIYSRRNAFTLEGYSTGMADRRRGSTSARATSERRVRSIGSQKHGTDKRLVVTGARCIDDPLDRLARLAIPTVTLSLLEILKYSKV